MHKVLVNKKQKLIPLPGGDGCVMSLNPGEFSLTNKGFLRLFEYTSRPYTPDTWQDFKAKNLTKAYPDLIIENRPESEEECMGIAVNSHGHSKTNLSTDGSEYVMYYPKSDIEKIARQYAKLIKLLPKF